MSEYPSGTVAFLFTDIEGSTALWERARPAMSAAVERHLALLREAITAHRRPDRAAPRGLGRSRSTAGADGDSCR